MVSFRAEMVFFRAEMAFFRAEMVFFRAELIFHFSTALFKFWIESIQSNQSNQSKSIKINQNQSKSIKIDQKSIDCWSICKWELRRTKVCMIEISALVMPNHALVPAPLVHDWASLVLKFSIMHTFVRRNSHIWIALGQKLFVLRKFWKKWKCQSICRFDI